MTITVLPPNAVRAGYKGTCVSQSQRRTPLKQCFTFKTTKCLLFVVKRVFDGWFRTDGYGEGKIRQNETLGGWPERVSATCFECEHFKTHIR